LFEILRAYDLESWSVRRGLAIDLTSWTQELAGLDVRVGRGDHLLLMTSLGVWDFSVNALIPHRRGRNHALMFGWGCGPLLLIGTGWVLALRDGLLNRIVRTTA
jgi:hypothetical protein